MVFVGGINCYAYQTKGIPANCPLPTPSTVFSCYLTPIGRILLSETHELELFVSTCSVNEAHRYTAAVMHAAKQKQKQSVLQFVHTKGSRSSFHLPATATRFTQRDPWNSHFLVLSRSLKEAQIASSCDVLPAGSVADDGQQKDMVTDCSPPQVWIAY